MLFLYLVDRSQHQLNFKSYKKVNIMNAKKAKKLRQLVRMAARDADGTPLPEVSYLENHGHRKFVTVEKISGDGKSTYKDKEQIAAGTIKVEARTVRGVYRGMKKQLSAVL